MNKVAVIVAGGSGSRMGTPVPKQFLELKGKPVLVHTVETFLRAFPDIEIILVLAPDFILQGSDLIKRYFEGNNIQIAEGGNSRYHSVQNGLKLFKGEAVIFVHDAVRCLVTEKLIQRCYQQALQKGSAVPAVPARDSIRMVEGNKSKAINRDNIRIIQTPQTFRSDVILPAFQQPYRDSFTDEATVVESSGKDIFLTEGEETNIKITLPADMLIAEKIIEERQMA
ncbi:MAG: 2-C-methyl-D-erythritol 4-phosphate cytidylyltransferase [Chitinophagaceae bacterium]|nr:2-C-methyl-D-erythritol 4-phosphate cytidylyltransferase [Chitinophagaceae bacterium]